MSYHPLLLLLSPLKIARPSFSVLSLFCKTSLSAPNHLPPLFNCLLLLGVPKHSKRPNTHRMTDCTLTSTAHLKRQSVQSLSFTSGSRAVRAAVSQATWPSSMNLRPALLAVGLWDWASVLGRRRNAGCLLTVPMPYKSSCKVHATRVCH